MPFSPYPVFKTERLLLRQLVAKDVNAIFRLRSDAIVNKYIDRPATVSIEQAADFIRYINNGIDDKKWFYWGITLKSKKGLVGTICLWNISGEKEIAETGYELMPEYHRKGIMHEAMRAVLDFAFNKMNLKIIKAMFTPANEASVKLLTRNYFQPDKENRFADKEGDEKLLVYYLEKEKWSYKPAIV